MRFFSGLHSLVRRLRPASEPAAPVPAGPHFGVEHKPGAIRLFHLRGDPGGVSQVVFEIVRHLPDPVGIIFVEYRERPTEWVSEEASRPGVLEALLGIRDLLGGGLLDLALFSPERGLELILGRAGDLEIRTGNWNEPLLRSLFAAGGFREVPFAEVSAVIPPSWVSLDEETANRLEAARLSLALHPPVADRQR